MSFWRKILRPALWSDSLFYPTRIYVEIIHYVNIYPSGTSEFIYFWRHLRLYLGVKIPGDSFLGIPLCFRWCLGINSLKRQLGSLLEFSRGHLGTNSFWRQLESPLGFVIPGDSFSGIPPGFPLLEFTMIVNLWGTTFSPVGGLLLFSFLGELHQSPNDRLPTFPSTQLPTMYIC